MRIVGFSVHAYSSVVARLVGENGNLRRLFARWAAPDLAFENSIVSGTLHSFVREREACANPPKFDGE